MITIYQAGTNAVRQIVNPLANSQQEQGVMGKDIVTINCSLPFAVNFGIGDYATVFDSLYKINVPPVLQKISGRNYQYTITLEGRIGDLGKTQFLFLDADNNFTESEFPLRARLIDFADFLLANIKRRYPDDPEYPIKNWQISGVQDTDFKDLTFSRNNCLDALNYAIKEFDTEYSLDGTKIYLYKRQPASGVLLRYGAGLYGLTRQPLDNGNIVNLLYAYGSDKNIGSDYRGGAKRLRMASGLFIQRPLADNEEVFEDTVIFEDIYPHRTGTVTAVTLPYTAPFTFVDSTIDFDVNAYLMPDGSAAVVTFNTGLLAGLNFPIHSYDATTKTFTINPDTDETTVTAPSETLTPVVGDQYVITNILQPIAYINKAEADLLTSAQNYLTANYKPKYTYDITCDPIYFSRNGVSLKLGQSISLQDSNLAIDLFTRITGMTRNLRVPSGYTLTLSDYITQPLVTKIITLLKSA